MLLNLSERYVIALNFLLVSLLAYLAAMTANDLIALRFSPVVVAPHTEQAPARLASAEHPRPYYDTIVRRDIFNITKAEAPAAPSPVMAADLHMKLLGTSLLTQSNPFAIIEDDANHEQSLYQLGDEIPGAGKLEVVEKDRVLINRGGQLVALEIPKEASSTVAAAPPMPPGGKHQPGGDGIRRMAGNQFMVDRRTVEQNLQNMAALFTQMRAVPNVENGKTNGFKLSEIQQGSLFQQMGLLDGDVIKTIGGQEINDPARAMEILPMLRNQQSLTIDVVRGGRPVALNFEIR